MYCDSIINSLTFITIALVCLYFYIQFYKLKYWQWRGIESPLGCNIIFGHWGDATWGKKNLLSVYNDIYASIKGKFGGYYMFWEPILLIKCPNLIKQISVDDFEIFTNRFHFECDEIPSKLYASITFLKDDEWKQMRKALGQSFTEFKVKHMTSTVAFLGLQFQESLAKSVDSGNTIFDGYNLMSEFLSGVICSTQLGLDAEENSWCRRFFCEIMDEISHPNFMPMWVGIAMYFFPKFSKFWSIGAINEIEQKVQKVSEAIIHQREANRVYRNDLTQALIQFRNTGKTSSDPITPICKDNEKHLSFDQIMAEIFEFISTGYITTSSCLSFALFEIGKSQQIQSIMQQEIDDVMKKYENSWSYECFAEMKYIDQVIDETLRKYPSMPLITRSNSRKWQIDNNSNAIIEKNTLLVFSIHSIHHDPKYYPNPNEFDPDRFSTEAKETRLPYTYLPYGLGPRNCLASKMGHVLVKIGLVTVLSKFNVELGDPTVQNLDYKINGYMVPIIKHKLRIRLRKNY